MAIKDYYLSDMATMFDDFAEPHLINGKQIDVIVDNDRLKERSQKEYDGISVGEILYFVKKSEYGERSKQGTPQVFDKKQMEVFDCREDSGLYEIILTQNRGVA